LCQIYEQLTLNVLPVIFEFLNAIELTLVNFELKSKLFEHSPENQAIQKITGKLVLAYRPNQLY